MYTEEELIGAENLAGAIVHQACIDFKRLLLSGRTYQRHDGKVETQETYLKFFKSEWFKLLTDMDGEYIVQNIANTKINKGVSNDI